MADISSLQLLSIACLGIYTGAMLTEGFLNVPYWRSLPPSEFFSWYAANDRRLIGYFRPLTSITALVAIAAAITLWWTNHPARVGATISAVLMALMIVMFFAIFRAINESFAHASISPAELPDALERWGRWHEVRIVLSVVALGASLWPLAP
ncbi:MAG TPA: DUF1772 domain-containing protein [Candidatus Limnocylindrales bacterium]|nr:DUF1772 domain-containing protein [Candidatus Limnocylindrales bacterium]